MLTKENNELLCRVGPGTPMGLLMRQYWVPALLSSELPAPDCAPVRVMLLGEKLIAFRDTSGRVGLLADACPHRGASLFFARNEECGLRCVYHGWKFDIGGKCVDMPSEPPESNFKHKVRTTAYPCRERGGLVWAYLGPRAEPPPMPQLEANMLPDGAYRAQATLWEANWLQGLEADIDTVHAVMLHEGSVPVEATAAGTFPRFILRQRTPSQYRAVDTPAGALFGAARPADEGNLYWRLSSFVLPFYTFTATGLLGHRVATNIRVPMDDEHTLWFSIGALGRDPGAQVFGMPDRGAPRATSQRGGLGGLWGLTGGSGYLPPTPGWFGRFRREANRDNDYFLDREAQRRGDSYSGMHGISVQDQALTESLGRIADRTLEHLGTSDVMILRVRDRLLRAATALRDRGEVPPGVDEPGAYAVRSGGVVLPPEADWEAATAELRKGFIEHPGLDPSIVGAIDGVAF